MRHGTKRLIWVALVAAMASPLAAETVLVETAPGGKGSNYYAEISGVWETVEAHSGASDLTSALGSRALPAIDGKLLGIAEFKPKVESAGLYHVDITWPSLANAKNVHVTVKGPEGIQSQFLNFAPGSVLGNLSGRWVRLSDMTLAAGDEITVTVDAGTSSGVIDTAAEYELVLSAVRATSDQNDAVVPPSTGTADGGGVASPFGDTAEPVQPASPFSDKEVAAAAETSPFEATAGVESPSSTGTQAQSGTTLPFKSDSGDPFVKLPPSGTSTSAAAAVETNPFDQPEVSDPFAKDIVVPPPPLAIAAATPPDNPFGETEKSASDPFTQAARPEPAPKEGVVSLAFTIPTEVKPEVAPSIAIPEAPKSEVKYADLSFFGSIEEAKKAALKDNLPIFVFFTGPSHRAEETEKLLRQEQVAGKLSSFELVKINYPANRALARQFAVRSFPYFVILNKYGYTLGHMTPSAEPDVILKNLSLYAQEY